MSCSLRYKQSIVTLQAIDTERLTRNKLHRLRMGWFFIAFPQHFKKTEKVKEANNAQEFQR